MAHYKLLFPNEYVGACDLEGGDAMVVIERIQIEELRNVEKKAEKKPVIWFRGAKKRMVLNKTNAKIIAGLYGNNTDSWKGEAIALYATTCESFGKTVECVRVRDQKPSKQNRTKAEPKTHARDYDPSTGEVAPEDEPPIGEKE